MEKRAQVNEWYRVSLFFLGFGLTVVLIILRFLIFSEVNSSSGITGNVVKTFQNCRDVQVSYEEEEEYLKTEYYTETIPYTDNKCENKNLAYSVTNEHWITSSCLDFDKVCHKGHNNFWGTYICDDEETFCAKRTLTYSGDINNLDSEKSGVWKVDIRFNVDHKLYETKTSSLSIYPQTTQSFTQSVTLISDGPSGIANKDGISAGFDVAKIPTKQICEEVTKYRDVQRTKEVTAYRPVTKYKTEEKCD